MGPNLPLLASAFGPAHDYKRKANSIVAVPGLCVFAPHSITHIRNDLMPLRYILIKRLFG